MISIDLRTNLLEGKGVKVRENGTASQRAKADTEKEIPYCFILNKVLPPEIRVLAWCPVADDFSARYKAIQRSSYLVLTCTFKATHFFLMLDRFSCLKRTYKYFFPKGELDLEVCISDLWSLECTAQCGSNNYTVLLTEDERRSQAAGRSARLSQLV